MIEKQIQYLVKLVSCASAKKYDLLPVIMDDLRSAVIDPVAIYESILQLYLFNGFPVAIQTLKVFKEHFPGYQPSKEQYNVNIFEKRGISNCKAVYNKNFDKLQSNISNLSPDLAEWMIIEGYGKVIGRSGLSLKERELLNVAMLCTNYSENQLHSHIRGSLNTGSAYEIIKEIIKYTEEYNSTENLLKSLYMLESINKPDLH